MLGEFWMMMEEDDNTKKDKFALAPGYYKWSFQSIAFF